VGREKWDRHEKICQSLFSLSSSRERSELSTLLLGSYKQPTTQKEKTGTDSIFGEKSRPWEELEEEREEREEERGGERREREERGRGWDAKNGTDTKKICQSLFSLSSSRERSELSTLLLGS